MDVTYVVLQVRQRLQAWGCNCNADIAVEDCGEYWEVQTEHAERCHLVMIRAGAYERRN
jgi:hypothetical protein